MPQGSVSEGLVKSARRGQTKKATRHKPRGRVGEGTLLCKFLEFDKYGRNVMHCFVNNADIGALMIKAGFAKDYSFFSNSFYKTEENFAKDNQLGIWK